jgi:hypothetical protein
MRSIAALVLSTALFLPAPASAEEAAWLAGEMVQVAAHRTDLPLPRMSSQPLMGYLARPDEPGRHPAVIELHGCGGFGTTDVVVADVLKSFGYVALALDSLGDANVCDKNPGDGELAEAFDAYAALDWLAEQSYVDSNRVALLGFSMGGGAILSGLEPGLIEDKQSRHFRAAIDIGRFGLMRREAGLSGIFPAGKLDYFPRLHPRPARLCGPHNVKPIGVQKKVWSPNSSLNCGTAGWLSGRASASN